MRSHYDWLVVGAGPAGQKAAIQAAKAGASVAVVERGRQVGGECVHRGTIPSKTLREVAVRLDRARHTPFAVHLPEATPMSHLLGQVGQTVADHVGVQLDQLQRNGIDVIHGRARFLDPHRVEVVSPRGAPRAVTADRFVVATGSVPRCLDHLPVDHEFVLDSDSILSQPYVPERLLVLGGGVIACEYATIFKQLGVAVTLVDRSPRPLGFMDEELSQRLVRTFVGGGCRHLPEDEVVTVSAGPVEVTARLASGAEVTVDKVMVALGRVANVERLGLDVIGVSRTRRGHVAVDDQYRTNIDHIYAVGDAIGFPALAATSMEQGRRAVRQALGLPVTCLDHACPVGIYTVPELACVGATEAAALDAHEAVRVGRCDFSEVARGMISGHEGLLKLICTADGQRILGVHAFGDGATELVHLGQLAMIGEMSPQVFVDNTFNFPTLAEAYRIAALALDRPSSLRHRDPDLALV